MANSDKLAFVLILLGAVSRLLPLPPNIALVTGVTIFAGFAISNRWIAVAVPVFAMLLADMVLGFYNELIYTYAGMVAGVFIAQALLGNLESPKLLNLNLPNSLLGRIIAAVLRLSGVAFLASLTFFLLSNLGVFMSGYYGYTLQGFIDCYIAAIPFWRNSLIADFVGTYLVFAVYYLITSILPSYKVGQTRSA